MSATAEQSELTKVLEEHCKKQLEEETKLNLLILGEPGIGKSTLINGLVGADVADTGAPGFLATAGITTEVKIYEYKCNNATINIWDTPGLLDPTCNSDEILEKVKEELSQIDLFLFGINMDKTRYLPENPTKKIIAKISQKIGEDFWKKTLIVLTRANVAITIMRITTAPEVVKSAYETLLEGFKTEVTKDIREYSKDSLKFAVAGIDREKKLFPDDIEFWLSAFWEKCFECIDSVPGKISLVKVNKDRLVLANDKQTKEATQKQEEKEKPEETEKPDQTKLQHQEIVLSENFQEKNKNTILSAVANAAIGGAVGGTAGAVAGGALTTAATAVAVTAVAANPLFWVVLGASAVGGGLAGLYYSYKSSDDSEKK